MRVKWRRRKETAILRLFFTLDCITTSEYNIDIEFYTFFCDFHHTKKWRKATKKIKYTFIFHLLFTTWLCSVQHKKTTFLIKFKFIVCAKGNREEVSSSEIMKEVKLYFIILSHLFSSPQKQWEKYKRI